jgi:hypothetical protein
MRGSGGPSRNGADRGLARRLLLGPHRIERRRPELESSRYRSITAGSACDRVLVELGDSQPGQVLADLGAYVRRVCSPSGADSSAPTY